MTQDLLKLVFNMLVISLVSFGSGASALFYDFGVTQTGWITSSDMSAILAFGYATPGPAAFGIATFIGYRIGGLFGAAAGTIAVFAAPWFLAMFAAKYLGGFLETRYATHFIKSIGLAAAGIVIYTGVSLMPAGSSANVGYILAAAVAFLLITKWKVNPLFILLLSGIFSFIISS